MAKVAKTDEEINKCFNVISELRPHLDRDSFLKLIRSMEAEGFQLAFECYQGDVVAVAGFRIFTSLSMGKKLYVDDLVTSSKHRSSGFGEKLFGWVRDIAIEDCCQFIHLDSGVQRTGAHKFYYNQGLTIAAYHFIEKL